MRVRGPAGRVRGDAIVEGQARCLGQPGIGRDADSDDHAVEGQFGAVRQNCAGHVVVSGKSLETNTFLDINAMSRMERAEVVRGLFCRDPLEDAVRHLDQRHVHAALGSHRGSLQPDVAAADNENPPPRGHLRRERVRVRQIAHDVDAGEVTANRGRQTAGDGPGGQGEGVVGDPGSIGQGDDFCPGVDPGRVRAGAQGDLLIIIPFARAQVEPCLFHLTQEVGFGERWSLIGRNGFGADQRDLPVEAFTTELAGKRLAGLAGADDDKMGHCPAP